MHRLSDKWLVEVSQREIKEVQYIAFDVGGAQCCCFFISEGSGSDSGRFSKCVTGVKKSQCDIEQYDFFMFAAMFASANEVS